VFECSSDTPLKTSEVGFDSSGPVPDARAVRRHEPSREVVIEDGQYGPLRNKARVVAGAFESAVKTLGDAIAYGDRGDRNKKVIFRHKKSTERWARAREEGYVLRQKV